MSFPLTLLTTYPHSCFVSQHSSPSILYIKDTIFYFVHSCLPLLQWKPNEGRILVCFVPCSYFPKLRKATGTENTFSNYLLNVHIQLRKSIASLPCRLQYFRTKVIFIYQHLMTASHTSHSNKKTSESCS